MSNNKLSKQSSFLDEFNLILNRLVEDENNKKLTYAIKSWCTELSIDKYELLIDKHCDIESEQFYKQFVDMIYKWIQDTSISKIFLNIYHKLVVVTDKKITKVGLAFFFLSKIPETDFYQISKDTQKEIPTKSILLIAFVLTAIGLLLFIFKKQIEGSNGNSGESVPNPPAVEKKYILALLINSDKYQEVIDSLKNNGQIQPEDGSKLYSATQGLWIGTESEFNESEIKKEFDSPTLATTTSEYDVYFVKIELDNDDPRFKPDVISIDRQDAFTELSKLSNKIKVSPRLSAKSYEFTEFHSR